jgi:haloalkane dehalogenase
MSRRPPWEAWLDPEAYPFAIRRFETGAGVMRYVDEGEGPVVLLIHDTPEWSFAWREVIADLAIDHRVVAPDMLGFGLSDNLPEGEEGFAGHTRRLAGLVARLGLADITLVVHGFGGPVALPLALMETSPVSRVVVANSWCWPLGNQPGHTLASRFIDSPVGRWLYLEAGLAERILMPLSLGGGKRLHRHVMRHYREPLGTPARRRGPYALARARVNEDAYFARLWSARDKLDALPLDLIWGLRDPVFGRASLSRWREAHTGAIVHELPHCGHHVPEEAPEAIVRVLRGLGT